VIIGCPSCGCLECDCTDDYSASGTGGTGRACEFTGGGSLDISSGVLTLTPSTPIVFASNGPDLNLTATTELTIVCQPSDSDGPSTIQLRAGIDGANYVYGQLAMTGGNVTISVGTSDGELDTEAAGTGGIAEFITLELCWKPPVATGTSSGVFAGADLANGDPEWEAEGVVENILDYPDTTTYCSCGSLGDDQTSGAVGIEWYPLLPADATITQITLSVYCEESADPANGIEDSEATATAGGVSLADKATNSAIPALGGGQLSYTWSGGDLTGVTAADINLFGMSAAMAFHMPLGSGGGSQPNVYYMLLTIAFTHTIKTPGRITLTYTKGATVECVSAITVDATGGGFPGLTAPADTWEVTSTVINCSSATCDTCAGEDTPVVHGCTECCTNDAPAEFTTDMSIGSLTPTSGSEGDCCTSISGNYIAELMEEGDCGIWKYSETIECENDGDRSFWIQVQLSSFGGFCYWQSYIYCKSDSGTIALMYQGPQINPIFDDCTDFPYTLTKQYEIHFGTADDTVFPNTVTLDPA
jgi:hypothetical protein